jgi:hypothetical protein
MFKQILSSVLFGVLFYKLTSYYLNKKELFLLIGNKIKYPIKGKLKYAKQEKLTNLKDLKYIIFYTIEKCQFDYIYHSIDDYYYLIEPGYYYYINENPNLIKHFNSNLNVFYSKIK